MGERTRAQLQRDVAAEKTALEQLRQAHETLAGNLAQTERRLGSAVKENDDLRDRLHAAEREISFMRGKLSVFDMPPMVESPAPPPMPPQPGFNRWDTAAGESGGNPWNRGGGYGDTAPETPWYRRR